MGTVHVSRYNPLAGRAYVQVPPYLRNKHCIVNVKNNDDRCFGYAILSALHPAKDNAERVSNYNHYFEQYHLHDLQYPIAPNDVPDVEDRLRIRINIFSFYDDKGAARYPLYVSKKDYVQSVDLLYWSEHYAWIKNFEGFVYDSTGHKERKFVCRRCFGRFAREPTFERHRLRCTRENFDSVLMTLPPEGTSISFKNVRYQLRSPIAIYADFECIVPKMPPAQTLNTKSATILYQSHKPCSIGLKIVSDLPQFANLSYEGHFGADSTTWLLKRLLEIEQKYLEYVFFYLISFK